MAASVPSFRQKANKANAQKSTGPRTPEGKEKSRMNNFRHGMCCVEAVPEADRAEYEARCALWVEQQNPQTDADMHILRRAVRAAMVLDRCEIREARVIDAHRRALLNNEALGIADQFTAAVGRLDEDTGPFEDLLESPRAMRFLASLFQLLAEKALSETPIEDHEFDAVTRMLKLWPKVAESWEETRRMVRAGEPMETLAAHCRDLGDAMYREADELAAEIDPAKHRATSLEARFQASAELDRIHMYEAAAERSFHRNFNALKQARRERERAARVASKSEAISCCDEERACDEDRPKAEVASKSKPISTCNDHDGADDESLKTRVASRSEAISTCDDHDGADEQRNVTGRASPAAA